MIYKCIYVVNEQNKHRNFGRAEGPDFELLLAGISEWLIDHPKPVWNEQLQEVARTPQEQFYRY
jgi:hypothetical protein